MAFQMKISIVVLAALLAGSAAAQGLKQTVPPAETVEQADARLAQVKEERAVAEREFAAQEAVCYTKFFVNNCLDKAKEQRRLRLNELRAIEIDANHFKRKYAVDERDRDLEQRARKDADDAAKNAANPPKPKANPADKPRPQPLAKTPAQRQAEHDARARERATQEAAQAGERAKKVEQFQAKQAESKERQEEIARKKAERAAKKAKHEADAAAKAAADAERARRKAQER
jgi:colicin import membrane protein